MGILPIILFFLGVVFLLLGYFWNSPNKETVLALKGLAYLKNEISMLQDKVLVLEEKIKNNNQIDQIGFKELIPTEADLKKVGLKEVESKEIEFRKEELKKEEPMEVELPETDHTVNDSKGKNKLYVLNTKDQRESSGRSEPQRNISPKYQEVLELAADGQPIQEIAQRLSLSQDAIRMVLRTQQGGETR